MKHNNTQSAVAVISDKIRAGRKNVRIKLVKKPPPIVAISAKIRNGLKN